MEVGDSFRYEGTRTKVPIAFATYLSRGKYETTKEGNGWRFHLKRAIKSKSNKSKFPFNTMKPDDSFYYEGVRGTAILAFGYYLASGRYETTEEVKTSDDGKEVKGWRFHLTKK